MIQNSSRLHFTDENKQFNLISTEVNITDEQRRVLYCTVQCTVCTALLVSTMLMYGRYIRHSTSVRYKQYRMYLQSKRRQLHRLRVQILHNLTRLHLKGLSKQIWRHEGN
jgi:hypothetical protein